MNRSTMTAKDFTRVLHDWFIKNRRLDPWHLEFQRQMNPYPVWVSEVMLQQTTIEAVVKAYQRLMKVAPTALAAAKLSEKEWMSLVAGLGYYRRFRMLRESLLNLTDDGKKEPVWPQTKLEWLSVSGVGEYTSSAIASIALGESCVVIDGNVERVLSRFLGIAEYSFGSKELKNAIRPFLEEAIELAENPGSYNQALMQLGQRVCMPHSPLCGECPIQRGCFAAKKGLQESIPLPKIRKTKTEVNLKLVVPVHAERRDEFGLVERPPSAKFLRGISGFPTVIAQEGVWFFDGLGQVKISARKLKSKGSFKHTITNHNIDVEVLEICGSEFEEKIMKLYPNPMISWIKKNKVGSQNQKNSIFMSRLDQKALQFLLRTV